MTPRTLSLPPTPPTPPAPAPIIDLGTPLETDGLCCNDNDDDDGLVVVEDENEAVAAWTAAEGCRLSNQSLLQKLPPPTTTLPWVLLKLLSAEVSASSSSY